MIKLRHKEVSKTLYLRRVHCRVQTSKRRGKLARLVEVVEADSDSETLLDKRYKQNFLGLVPPVEGLRPVLR